jgi:ABC-type transport system involved in multi-copper enzyme maturation permease subunit
VSALTIGRVAAATFRETVRDRVLYGLVAFAVLLIAASVLLAQLTAGQDLKIVKDLGLAAMSFIGLFIAVFIGVGLVWKEIDRRTIYSLLAKPVRRSELVMGKYAGLVLTLAVNLALMAATVYLVLTWLSWVQPPAVQRAWEAPAIDPRLLVAMLLIFVELTVVVAVALFFSTFANPLSAAAFTLALFVAGQFSADLKHLHAVLDSPITTALATTLYYVLPDFTMFDVKAAVVHGHPVGTGYAAIAVTYGALYVGGLLLLSVVLFSKRDLK